MPKKSRFFVVLVATFAFMVSIAPLANATTIGPNRILKAQQQLNKLGFETGPADGIVGPQTARMMCAFELLYKLKARLGTMSVRQYNALMNTNKLRKPWHKTRRYIGISIKCQSGYQVRKGHRYVRIIPVSTGHKGKDSQGRPSSATAVGVHPILSRQHGLIESNIYSGGFMRNPMFFTAKGQAIHGEDNPEAVWPYKASHGCVRTLRHDQAVLWHFYREGDVLIIKGHKPV